MTEEEAKTKVCHLTLNPVAKSIASAMMQNGGSWQWKLEHQMCLGSSCMAWRETNEGKSKEPVFAGVIEGTASDGFCGLAGKP